jgi:biopolymer transport protein ExbB
MGMVSKPISEALVVTAAGILVAVEAVVLFNYFNQRAARIGGELKLLTEEFLELLGDAPPESTEVGDNTERAGGTAKGKGDGRQAA